MAEVPTVEITKVDVIRGGRMAGMPPSATTRVSAMNRTMAPKTKSTATAKGRPIADSQAATINRPATSPKKACR